MTLSKSREQQPPSSKFTVIISFYQAIALLGRYVELTGSYWNLETGYRSHRQGSSSQRMASQHLKMVMTDRPETSVANYQSTLYLTSQKSEDLIYTTVEGWNHANIHQWNDARILIFLSIPAFIMLWLGMYTHTHTHARYPKDWLVYLDYSKIFTKINNYKHPSPHCSEPVL